MGLSLSIARLRATLPTVTRHDLYCIAETNPDKIFMFLGDLVIDATEFIASHPGGATAITKRHMCDITEDYKFHRSTGRQKILEFATHRVVG